MLSGQCVGLNGAKCDCGAELELKVCKSAAGHYLGYICPNCGPYSRETGYMTEEDAELAWDLLNIKTLYNADETKSCRFESEYHPNGYYDFLITRENDLTGAKSVTRCTEHQAMRKYKILLKSGWTGCPFGGGRCNVINGDCTTCLSAD